MDEGPTTPLEKAITEFRDFIASNIDNWARVLRDVNRTGELRLITGHLCAPYWGIATFKGNKDANPKLLLSQQSPEKDQRFMWQAPPGVKTSLSGKLPFNRPSDALAITAFTITPRASICDDDRMAVVNIMTSLDKDRAPGVHLGLLASTMWARYQFSGEHKYLESSILCWHKALDGRPRKRSVGAIRAIPISSRSQRGRYPLPGPSFQSDI